MTDKDPEELLAQSKEQKRHTSEPATDADDTSLEDAIVAVYDDLEAGDVSSNITIRDDNLAALLRGLERAGELDSLTSDVRDHLGREGSGDGRGPAAALLVRAGLREARPDLLETGRDAYDRHLRDQADDF